MCWSLELTKVGARIYRDASLTAAERIAGLSFGEAAQAEARARARQIADRLRPLGPKAHGFYEPAAFIDRARQRGENKRVFLRAYDRLLGVIIARDGLLQGGAA